MPLVHTCCFLEPARLIAAIDLCELPPQPSAEPPMAVNATEGIRAGFHGVTAQSAALHYFIIYSPNSGTAENEVQGATVEGTYYTAGRQRMPLRAQQSKEHTTQRDGRECRSGRQQAREFTTVAEQTIVRGGVNDRARSRHQRHYMPSLPTAC